MRLEATEAALAVGERLRALRRERGLSLEELAAQCGVSRSMLSKIERDESLPTVGVAVRIAAALSVPLVQLLGVDERPQVEFRPAAHQEVIADPRSGTTRYRLTGELAGALRAERLAAPPGATALVLPPLAPGALLVISVGRGRFRVTVGDGRWQVGEGDALTIRGPASVALHPHPAELAVADLTWASAGEGAS
jgi:transcriptional regulator with XRE-family HTH domain